MGARWRCLLAASVTGLLLLSAVHCIRTEWGYSAALGYGRSASEDLPGRLEAYEVAAESDPLEPQYALRAAQVHLRRAVRSGGETRREMHISRALILLQQARDALPHGAKIRAETARALELAGRHREALAESAIAARLGPSNPGVLMLSLRLRTAAWSRTREITHLREALRLIASVAALGEPHARMGARQTIGREEATSLGDFLEAVAGRPDLAREAAELLRPIRHDDAAILDGWGPREAEELR